MGFRFGQRGFGLAARYVFEVCGQVVPLELADPRSRQLVGRQGDSYYAPVCGGRAVVRQYGGVAYGGFRGFGAAGRGHEFRLYAHYRLQNILVHQNPDFENFRRLRRYLRLHFGGVYVFAVGQHYDLLAPARDEEKALVVDVAEVSGKEPSVAYGGLCLIGAVVVAAGDVFAAHGDFAVRYSYLDAGQGFPGRADFNPADSRKGYYRGALRHSVSFAQGETERVEIRPHIAVERGAARNPEFDFPAELLVYGRKQREPKICGCRARGRGQRRPSKAPSGLSLPLCSCAEARRSAARL